LSERDGFSQCLVDGDKQSGDKARLIRQKAVLISIIFEAALIAVLLLWPLITPGLPPQQFLVTPAPPYHGGSSSSPQVGHHGSPLHHKTDGPTMMYPVAFQPTRFPEHAQSLSSDEAPAIGSGFGPGNMPGFGMGDGESIHGGGESNMRPVPPQPKPKPEKPRPMSEGVMEAA